MLWPNGNATKPYVTSAFGPRNINVPNASKYHRGADMVGFSAVRAVAAGVVRVVGRQPGWAGGGIQVWVQHDGFFSKSLHLRSTSVRVGQEIDEAHALGVMGMTGTASDVHLHFEITPGRLHYLNIGQIDPVEFIKDRLAAPAGGSNVAPAAKEDDDMLALLIDGAHKCTLAPGTFSHMITSDNPDRVKNIVRADDQWTTINRSELPVLLRRYGCDLHIWDIRAGKFVVLDPLDGSVREGNVWTAANQARAESRAGFQAQAVTSAETTEYLKQLAS